MINANKETKAKIIIKNISITRIILQKSKKENPP